MSRLCDLRAALLARFGFGDFMPAASNNTHNEVQSLMQVAQEFKQLGEEMKQDARKGRSSIDLTDTIQTMMRDI